MTLQTVVVCVDAVGATNTVCPANTAPATVQAYLLSETEASAFLENSKPFDLALAGTFWGTSFMFILGLYFSSYIYKSIIRMVR